MSVDDCMHWSRHALEENGYNVWQNSNVTQGNKDPHVAVVFCYAAPAITFVIASNASGDDARHESQEFSRRMKWIARSRDRDRDRDRDWDRRR